MPKNVFPLDSSKKFTDQQYVGHNRWHPDIPAAVRIKPGETFRADCREWFDGAIKNDDSADDIRHAPLAGVHVLSGPFHVEGAEPGDLLVVDILEIDSCDQEDSGPFSGQGWGYTGVFATKNGGGFLTERFPDAYKVIWDFAGDVATSRHIPELSYVGIHHPGLMGTAPSAELLARWTKRELALIETDPYRVPPLALPPLPDSAILGNSSSRSNESSYKSAFDLSTALPILVGKITGDANAGTTSTSKGQGNIGRSEKIQLSVAAIVTELLPNGNLLISGSQEVRVNYELRELRVSGIVRPRDVSRDNTIAYDKIAEARISYGGRGRLSEAQQPGLVHQVIDVLRPF